MPAPHGSADVGFSIHPNVLTESETAELLTALSTVGRTRAGARHLMAVPAVARIASDPRLLVLAREVLGPSAAPYRATLFDKSVDANWLVVWHQDTALPLRRRVERPGWGPWSTKAGVLYAHAPASALERVVALRLHLDASTAENGPLRVIPGSHMSGVLGEQAIHDMARRCAPTVCLVGIGGVLRMRPLLVHSSSKALSAAPRRVLHVEYGASLRIEAGLDQEVA
jgi:ectoine hydroxylase-related dioxygenase (phytanoyl-CoA dioxygenase family)